jgi:hypothetical protein
MMYLIRHLIFSKYYLLKFPYIVKRHSFYVFFNLFAFTEYTRKVFKCMRRIQKFRAVFGTQNHLRIHGKNLCVYGEDAKIHKNEDISLNNGLT